MQNVEISSVVKVIDIFLYQGKTYKIMEKSPGIQMDKLTPEQIQSIPQEHYDKYIQDTQAIEAAGLKIDPSKPSNFFYDKLTGFHFIDLDVKDSNWSMFDHASSFNARNILVNDKIQIAIEKNSARAVDISNQKGVNTETVNKSERLDLRKMNPDTQVIIDKLKTDYP